MAADALKAWLEAARIKSGPVFRRIDRWERVSERGLSPFGVNYVVKQCLKRAGHGSKAYSAHGLRAGFLTQAAKDGVPLPRGDAAIAASLGPAGGELLQRCRGRTEPGRALWNGDDYSGYSLPLGHRAGICITLSRLSYSGCGVQASNAEDRPEA